MIKRTLLSFFAVAIFAFVAVPAFAQVSQPKFKRLSEIGQPISKTEADSVMGKTSKDLNQPEAMLESGNEGILGADAVIINYRPADFNPLLIADTGPLAAGTGIVTQFEDLSSGQSLILDQIRLTDDVGGFGLFLWEGYVPNAYKAGARFTIFIQVGRQRFVATYDFRPNSNFQPPVLTGVSQVGSLLKLKGRFPRTRQVPSVMVNGGRVSPLSIVGYDQTQILVDLALEQNLYLNYGGYNLFVVKVANKCASLQQFLDFPGFTGVGIGSSEPTTTTSAQSAAAIDRRAKKQFLDQ